MNAKLKKIAELKGRMSEMGSQLAVATSNTNLYEEENKKYWSIGLGKEESGYAIIRLLPPAEDEDMPFVTVEDYFLKRRNKGDDADKKPFNYYITRSLTSAGGRDPVNDEFWFHMEKAVKNNDETAKKVARESYGANRHYIMWILVVEDPKNPSNNGQVKKFKMTPGLFKLVQEQLNPDENLGETGCNPFDLWEGKNLRIVAKYDSTKRMRSYASSKFEEVSAVGDDDYIAEVYDQVTGLKDELDVNNKLKFKYSTYDEALVAFEKFIERPVSINKESMKLIGQDEPTAIEYKETKTTQTANVVDADYEETDDDDVDALLADVM